jgi:hypothetical protein
VKRLREDQMSHDGKEGNIAKRLLVDLLMGIVFLLLLSFSLWLIWLTYFREYFDTGMVENANSEYFQVASTHQTGYQSRFHNMEDDELSNDDSVSACIKCHDEFAHSKSKEKRAFLNAHSYFMACEVCHSKTEGNSEVVYLWSDTKTGHFLNNRPANTRAKITPTKKVNGDIRSLESVKDKEFIQNYLTSKDTLNESQLKVIVERTHKNMLSSPITCIDCHTVEKRPYLPLSQLAYSTARIEELTRTEVVGMMKKYESFYMPELSRGTENRNN